MSGVDDRQESDREKSGQRENGEPDLDRLRQQAREIGHDISNVIQAIIGEAELLAAGTPAPAQLQESADAIVSYAAQAATLAGKLRSLGRPEVAGQPSGVARPAAGAATAVAEAAVAVAGKAIRRGQRRARILVVEDQEPVREFIGTALAEHGHEVALAGDGAAAVEAAGSADFDLVLMDVHMPVMDGLEATRRIRALAGPRSKVAIVGISANVPPQQVQSLLAAGMDDHFAKPFTRPALVGKVDQLLARSLLAGSRRAEGPPDPPDLAALIEMMGRPFVMSGLARLQAEIDAAFGPEDAARDLARLAVQAHALVSLAALLGFATLSGLCSALENDCKDGADWRPAFAAAREAALDARREAARLLADG